MNATPAASRLDRLLPLLRSEPDNLQLHRECVTLAMSSAEYQRALDLVNARLERHPADAECLFARSNALMGLKRYAEAIGVLEPLERANVAPVAVMTNLATCHYALAQYESARAYADGLLAAGERSADLVQLAISSRHHAGEVGAAAALADEHVALAESHAALAGSCALAYLDDEQPEKAARLAALALARNPDSVDGLTVQATLAAAALDADQAARQFARVVELAPQSGRAWLGLGMLAILSQDYARARELLARATEIMPTHLGSWHGRAWAHLFSGDVAGAEQYIQQALRIDPDFGESHGALAAMLAMRGDRAGAEREIQLAERLDRDGMSVQLAHAVLAGQTGGPEAGHARVRDAMRLWSRKAPRT